MLMAIWLLIYFAFLATIVFVSAGTLHLPFVWASLGIYFGFAMWIVTHIDPELRKERVKPGPGGKDRFIRHILTPFIIAYWVVAGLDVGRYRWSVMPLALQIVGFVGFTAGYVWFAWAMQVNRFFSPVVRIQSERGHHLVREGPYAIMRHPGYAGAMVTSIFGPFALGSWWAIVPAAVFIVVFLRRTLIEDAFLHKELPGYAEYAQKVRYRWLPGVW